MLSKWIPGLQWIRAYRREWLLSDLLAGVSVAAVALPTAVAYASLVNLEPVYGIYASIVPLFVYAFLGSSRQLIINPDSATCAMVAAAVAPLAVASGESQVGLVMSVTIAAGAFCVLGGFLKLGFVADFLSKPILIGYLNGVSLHIMTGQAGKVMGYKSEAHGVVQTIAEVFRKIDQINWATFGTALLTAVVILTCKRISRMIPAVLVAILVAIAMVKAFGLEAKGVSVVGSIPAGLPSFRLPGVPLDALDGLVGGAVAVALISFSSNMVTARSFAARNHYDLDGNQDMIALGVANIAAGFSQGFAVAGADSRTAISDGMGGKTQLTGIVAGIAMALVLLFFTAPLAYLPKAALGAVLIVAAAGLFDWKSLVSLWKVAKGECVIAMITTASVIWLDVLKSILMAVGLSLLVMLWRIARPKYAEVARVPGVKGFHNIAHYPNAEPVPGLVMVRFGADILFFNADYIRHAAIRAAQAPGTRWVVVDFSTVNFVDFTGLEALKATCEQVRAMGLVFAMANVSTEVRDAMRTSGLYDFIGAQNDYPTLKSARKAYKEAHPDIAPAKNEPADDIENEVTA